MLDAPFRFSFLRSVASPVFVSLHTSLVRAAKTPSSTQILPPRLNGLRHSLVPLCNSTTTGLATTLRTEKLHYAMSPPPCRLCPLCSPPTFLHRTILVYIIFSYLSRNRHSLPPAFRDKQNYVN